MTDPHNVQTERTPMPTLNPKLVEALRKNNGWVRIYATSDWACVAQKKCRTIHEFSECPRVDHHESDCPCREMFMDDAHPSNCACPDCEPEPINPHSERSNLVMRMGMVEDRLDAIEAKPATPTQAAPKCNLCGDTKLIQVKHHGKKGFESSLCSCLKVGDVVSAEVANMLPVGSKIYYKHNDGAMGYWQKTEGDDKWLGHGHNGKPTRRMKITGDDWAITRIGPAPVAPQPEDICERWATAVLTSEGATSEEFRRLGLPEMAAVCEITKVVRSNGLNRENWYSLLEALDALSAKEKSNGKA